MGLGPLAVLASYGMGSASAGTASITEVFRRHNAAHSLAEATLRSYRHRLEAGKSADSVRWRANTRAPA